jgi:hypothetical protein
MVECIGYVARAKRGGYTATSILSDQLCHRGGRPYANCQSGGNEIEQLVRECHTVVVTVGFKEIKPYIVFRDLLNDLRRSDRLVESHSARG